MESSVTRMQRATRWLLSCRWSTHRWKKANSPLGRPRSATIQGHSTVLVWLRKRGCQNWDSALSGLACQSDKNPHLRLAAPLTPEQKIKASEVRLREANERSDSSRR